MDGRAGALCSRLERSVPAGTMAAGLTSGRRLAGRVGRVVVGQAKAKPPRALGHELIETYAETAGDLGVETVWPGADVA